MLPAGIWVCLATGIVLIGLPSRRTSPQLCFVGALLICGGFLSPLWHSPPLGDSWTSGWWSAVAWWIGFGWTPHITSAGPRWSPHSLGWSTLTATGLLTATISNDWVTLLLALELVRQSTLPHGIDNAAAWETWSPMIFTAALTGWVAVTGGITLDEWRHVLADSYAMSNTTVTIGRPSLILIGATVLTVFGVAGPVFWTWHSSAGPRPHASLGERLAASTARQLASITVLQRILTGGTAGLEPTWIIALSVTAIASWCVAVRWLSDRQRFDRVMLGATQFQWGTLLLWVSVALGKTRSTDTAGELLSSVNVQSILALALVNHVLLFSGIAAGATWLISESDGASFLEQFRGLGTLRPLPSGALLLLLASLIGLPMTVGFWIRCTWLLSVLGMQQVGADSSVAPHWGLLVAALLGILTWAVVAGAIGHVARLMLFDPAIGSTVPKAHWWPAAIAIITATTALITGFAPVLLF